MMIKLNIAIYLLFLQLIACEQCDIGSTGCCDTMLPPSSIPPDDSSCWQWWEPPPNGIVTQDMPVPPKGCDYKACQNAVCACDSYCCESAWDLSCRGYALIGGDTVKNNYFVDQCSARLLCCEPETAFPKPQPVNPPPSEEIFPEILPTIDESSQCAPGSPNCCNTLIPPSYVTPDDSNCWKWWDPPIGGDFKPEMSEPPKGCDYAPCEQAVCACDSYCCESAWDLSCRGYSYESGDQIDNNYFVDQCSARKLCCETELSFPKPPEAAIPVSEVVPNKVTVPDTSFQCAPGEPNCCETMVPPSYFPPDDSNCWRWWTPPPEGKLSPDAPLPSKGCSYQPCQDAVCACDSYCCNAAWDLSCRGYESAQGDVTPNNYFVEGCSAKILCCEPESAFPDPPPGALNPPRPSTSPLPNTSSSNSSSSTSTSTSTSTINESTIINTVTYADTAQGTSPSGSSSSISISSIVSRPGYLTPIFSSSSSSSSSSSVVIIHVPVVPTPVIATPVIATPVIATPVVTSPADPSIIVPPKNSSGSSSSSSSSNIISIPVASSNTVIDVNVNKKKIKKKKIASSTIKEQEADHIFITEKTNIFDQAKKGAKKGKSKGKSKGKHKGKSNGKSRGKSKGKSKGISKGKSGKRK